MTHPDNLPKPDPDKMIWADATPRRDGRYYGRNELLDFRVSDDRQTFRPLKAGESIPPKLTVADLLKTPGEAKPVRPYDLPYEWTQAEILDHVDIPEGQTRLTWRPLIDLCFESDEVVEVYAYWFDGVFCAVYTKEGDRNGYQILKVNLDAYDAMTAWWRSLIPGKPEQPDNLDAIDVEPRSYAAFDLINGAPQMRITSPRWSFHFHEDDFSALGATYNGAPASFVRWAHTDVKRYSRDKRENLIVIEVDGQQITVDAREIVFTRFTR